MLRSWNTRYCKIITANAYLETPEVANNIYTLLKRLYHHIGSVWHGLSDFLLTQFTTAGKKVNRKNAREKEEKNAFCRSECKSESAKMVGEESESKKEIKIHERFERHRIKIHGGIIAGPTKTKARDSSTHTRESFTTRVSRSQTDFLFIGIQRSWLPIRGLHNIISYFLHSTFVLLPLRFPSCFSILIS